MKRPRFWLRWLTAFIVLVVAVQYTFLTWFVPRYFTRAVQRLTAGEVAVRNAQLSPQLSAVLTGLYARHNTQEAFLRIQALTIHPKQLWFMPRLLEVESIDVERPFIRVTRTQAGTFLWPQVKAALDSQNPAGLHLAESKLHRALRWIAARWRLQANVVRVANGTLEFIDEGPATPFHLALEHATVSIGPLSYPEHGEPVSFAVRGLLTGFEGRSAPVYCSGWITRQSGDLEISCQLEPLALALFDPYFQEFPVIRVYSATLAFTMQWTAKAHDMQASLHVELDHLDEGDISVRGHTVLNIKRLANAGERRLVAEIAVNGNLERIDSWSGRFIPGNEPAQRLVEHLLEREIKALGVSLGKSRISLQLLPAGGVEMQGMQAASKEISEALELLAAPVVFSVPVNAAPPRVTETAPIVFSPNMILGLEPLEESFAPAAPEATPSEPVRF